MDDTVELYTMLLLADGNLPTGSFVASSAFESFVKHGFFLPGASSSPTSTPAQTNAAIVDFIRDSLGSYARSALPLVSNAHTVVSGYRTLLAGCGGSSTEDSQAAVLRQIHRLDELYHSITLNEVTRRASKSQGVALLTLYSKGFSEPSLPAIQQSSTFAAKATDDDTDIRQRLALLVDRLKLEIRREDTHGHLPICWGVLTAALGMGLERSQYLHLFLQARAQLSAAIRLNTLGPYAAQQVLLHVVKEIVESQFVACKDLRGGLALDEQSDEIPFGVEGASTTWPLGEILAARHDLQHSRIFNS